jgi:hypothetical protein
MSHVILKGPNLRLGIPAKTEKIDATKSIYVLFNDAEGAMNQFAVATVTGWKALTLQADSTYDADEFKSVGTFIQALLTQYKDATIKVTSIGTILYFIYMLQKDNTAWDESINIELLAVTGSNTLRLTREMLRALNISELDNAQTLTMNISD